MTILHHAILRTASLLVPSRQRPEWLAEWTAELWHVAAHRKEAATTFCLGAFSDAFWLRCHSRSQAAWLSSPVRCLLLLAFAATVSVSYAISHEVWRQVPYHPLSLHLLNLLIALAILPAFSPIALGDYPALTPPRRWAFLAAKIVLLLVTASFGSLDLAALTFTPLQPHGLLLGYILALRWALADQRKRCPVCLRLVTNPTRIGWSSQTFLEWYGTEFTCARGHGLLHVSEIETSSATPQRWQYLDSSWSDLFLKQP